MQPSDFQCTSSVIWATLSLCVPSCDPLRPSATLNIVLGWESVGFRSEEVSLTVSDSVRTRPWLPR